MAHFRILTLLICFTFTLISCKEIKVETTTKTKEDARVPFKGFNVPSQQNATAQNAQGVYHYTCSDGCAGGAAAAGNCISCGKALAHNQAYHANTNNTPLTTPTNTASTPTTESGQNAAGVWHYTCSNGCAGGAGSAGNCVSCGNTLAHNSAYH